MKKVNEDQAKINFHLMELGIGSPDEDTRVAILSASAAFQNYIQFGVETKSIYGSELIHDSPKITEDTTTGSTSN